MKKIFICSRYAGDITKNRQTARELCMKAIREGHSPFASHLFYPSLLNENDQMSRKKGIDCGLEFLKCCNEVWLYDLDGISEGMRTEMQCANENNISIINIYIARH